MKTGTSSATGCKLTCVVVLLLLVSVGVGQAAERVTIPDQLSLPYYVRPLHLEVDGTNTTVVAFVFYRWPAPDNWNLLRLFDFSGIDENEYLLQVEGFAIRDPEAPSPPMKQHLQEAAGGAVPILFADRSETDEFYYLDRNGDGAPDRIITFAELMGMASLREGLAAPFMEELHPAGGAERTLVSIQASGILDDGASFSLIYELLSGELKVASVKFK
ncbi:MAG: hypothetical protein R6V07_07865 [Armatimonadota bacterium]